MCMCIRILYKNLWGSVLFEILSRVPKLIPEYIQWMFHLMRHNRFHPRSASRRWLGSGQRSSRIRCTPSEEHDSFEGRPELLVAQRVHQGVTRRVEVGHPEREGDHVAADDVSTVEGHQVEREVEGQPAHRVRQDYITGYVGWC